MKMWLFLKYRRPFETTATNGDSVNDRLSAKEKKQKQD